jgi:hypothetical protein
VSAADTYAARVDATLAQRTRLRGPQPTSDPFGDQPADSPLIRVDPRGPAPPNMDVITSYVESDDVIVDVGGGGGRFGLPLALRCRQVVNVDPSAVMVAAFEENARRAGIANVSAIHADWLEVDPPPCTLALAKHVAYLTRDIVPFVQKLDAAAARRVLITVNSPPPLEWHAAARPRRGRGACTRPRRADERALGAGHRARSADASAPGRGIRGGSGS